MEVISPKLTPSSTKTTLLPPNKCTVALKSKTKPAEPLVHQCKDLFWIAVRGCEGRQAASLPAEKGLALWHLTPVLVGKGSCSPAKSPSLLNRMGRQRLSSCSSELFWKCVISWFLPCKPQERSSDPPSAKPSLQAQASIVYSASSSGVCQPCFAAVKPTGC